MSRLASVNRQKAGANNSRVGKILKFDIPMRIRGRKFEFWTEMIHLTPITTRFSAKRLAQCAKIAKFGSKTCFFTGWSLRKCGFEVK